MPRVSSHWKMPVPFPRFGGRQALRQIQRDDHTDQAGADALQEAAKNQRLVAVRERDHRNADDEQHAAEGHQKLASHPVGERAGK